MSSRPASPEETAAVVAVLSVLAAESAPAPAPAGPKDHLSMWVEASRRSAQRAPLTRGPWRLSGRIGRRSRT